MDMKKILIGIIVVLAIIELYILTSSEPQTNTPIQTPVAPKSQTPMQQPSVADTPQISYPDLYNQEVVDESWAKATEVQIYDTAKKLSTKYSSYFNKFYTACKSTICKVEVATQSSNQPFPIMVADFVYAMKAQGWLSDVAVLTEEASGELSSGSAEIYLLNPTR
jgi:hypothetical protein